jgi:hypothetical protein
MMKHMIKIRLVNVLYALLLGFVVSPAEGREAREFTTNINAQSFSDGLPHFLNLTGVVGNDRIIIQSPNIGEDEHIIIWFAAECAVAAGDTRTWVDIDILANGFVMPPTDENNAFCTSNGTNALSWVSAATHGAFLDVVHTDLAAASYDIRVRGKLQHFNQGERWTIDDLSLIIFIGW